MRSSGMPDGVPEIGAQNKTKEIIQSDVGKTITCDITVAEPDGTNPETRTAVYNKVPEVAGTINTPSVLSTTGWSRFRRPALPEV